MIKASLEYIGFRTASDRREYLLRSHSGTETREYTVGIAHAAFAAGRARFQDGPEICYLKLHRELQACADQPDEDDFTITDAELAAYRDAHAPRARRLGPTAAATGAAKGDGEASPRQPAPPHD